MQRMRAEVAILISEIVRPPLWDLKWMNGSSPSNPTTANNRLAWQLQRSS